MKAKKWMACIMALAMAAGITACGGNGNQQGKIEINKTGYPIVNEKATIKVMAPDWWNAGDYNNKKVIQELEQKTNVHVEWQTFSGDAKEKISLAFASGENIPDAFLMADMSSAVVDQYGEDGLIIPVESLIDKYAPNIKNAMAEFPTGKKAATAADGHMYVVPSIYPNPSEQIRGIPYINTKALQKIGKEMPTTTEELYEVLKALKGSDWNENGEDDEIPMVLYWDNNLTGISSMFGPWGVSSAFTGAGGSCDAGPFFVKNGTVVVSNMQESYREAIRYFHMLYSEGLINADTFTGDSNAINAKANSGQIAGVKFTSTFTYPDENVSPDEVTYQALPLLQGPNGEKNIFAPVYGVFTNNYISANCKNPELVMRWMDATADPETSYSMTQGGIGYTIERGENGKFVQKPIPDGYIRNEWRVKESYIFPVMGITPSWLEANVDFNNEPDIKGKVQAIEPMLPYANMMTVEHLRYTAEERTVLSTYLTQIVDYSKQKEAEWITNGKIDEEWENHLDQMEKMNVQEVLSIMQKAVERWENIK